MRAQWATLGALLLLTAASCPGRAPSQQAAVQAQQEQAPPAPPAEPTPPGEEPKPQAPAEAVPAGEREAETHEVILEHADRVRYDNKTKEYELSGDIVLRHEDGVLRAQLVRVNADTKRGVATGDLSFADEQTTVTANRLEIDFDARHAVFRGDVRLVTQRKPTEETQQQPGETTPAAETKREPTPAEKAPEQGEEEKPLREYWEERTEIRCPQLEYFYRENRAVATGGVTARQKDRRGRADEAVYTDDDELLVLRGNVEMENEKGETFRADQVTISLAEDWLEAQGIHDSRFLIEEKEAQPTEEKATAPAPTESEAEPPQEQPPQQ